VYFKCGCAQTLFRVEEGDSQYEVLQFGKDLPSMQAGVVPIPKGELRVINIDPHYKEKKDLVPILTLQGEIIWVHPDLVQSQ